MSSLNQLISEIAHSVQQPDSIPVRRAIRLQIIHARNELIRKSYNNHNITDKILQQRFRLSLTNVKDGDQIDVINTSLPVIKRTTCKVPRPVRLTNNLPFHSVRTSGVANPIEIAFVKEPSARFYKYLPGMNCAITYDYINEYIYLNIINNDMFNNLGYIVVESVFEQPQLIQTEANGEIINPNIIDDNDEFLLPEDLIEPIKRLIFKTYNSNIIRQTNEIPVNNLVK